MKLWGGRFESGPSELFERFSESLSFDRRLIDCDCRGSQAFARALARAGILTAQECERLVEAFEGIREQALEPGFEADATDEDVHTLVIRKLKERVGELAGQDSYRTQPQRAGLARYPAVAARGDRPAARAVARHCWTRLLWIGRQYPAAVIPGYTHTRRAQAVLWPHYILAYFEMFARDAERLSDARRRTDVMPLGSGALAGSGFPFDREAIAADLGFAAITRNSMDVSGDRDFALDFLYAASMVMLHLSRFCEDWILYSGEEFNWIELGDEVTSGSAA